MGMGMIKIKCGKVNGTKTSEEVSSRGAFTIMLHNVDNVLDAYDLA
jgi:hypothetical protein